MMSDDERRMVELLGDQIWTVDFTEDWLSAEADSVSVNPLAALQKAEALGFMTAVRCFLKDDVRHSIYREVREENMCEDIRNRLHELDEDDLGEKNPDELANDESFLSGVFQRWEKSLGWCDSAYDTYWATCDEAIKSEIARKE